MALQTKDFSASTTVGSVTYTFTIRVTENSVDMARNSSNLTVQAILSQNGGGGFTGTLTGVSCSLNGQQIFSDYRARNLQGTQAHIYESWTGDVTHAIDGQMQLSIVARLWQSGSLSLKLGGETMALTSIPRGATAGASDANIGSNTTVVINNTDSRLRCSIFWEFGQLSGYVGADGTETQQEVRLQQNIISFRLPDSFYSQIPNSTWGFCTLTISTFSGGQRVGTTVTRFRATADESLCAPVVTAAVTDVNPVTVALTGDAEKLVRYCSDALCEAVAQPQNGASIVSLQVNGTNMDGAVTLPQTETGQYVFTATDSRGYQTVVTVVRPLMAYVQLTCNPCARRTAPTTGQVLLELEGNCYRGSFGVGENTLAGQCRVMELEGQWGPWHTVPLTPDPEHTYRGTLILEGLDYTRPHEIQVQVWDAVHTVTAQTGVQQGIPVFDWGSNYFNFHVPVHFEAGVTGLS